MEPRNYLANASAIPPAKPAAPSQGYPQTAVPGVNPATTPGPFWYYKIGEELRGIINGAGITPSDADITQLLQALEILYLNQSEGDARYVQSSNAPSIISAHIGARDYLNLLVQPSLVTPSTQVDFVADEALLKTSDGGLAYLASGIATTLDVTAVGVNGLDVAYAGTPEIYYGFLISDGVTLSSFASTSQTPTLPNGYTYSSLITAFYVNGASGSPSILSFHQTDNIVSLSDYIVVNSVSSGSYTAVSIPAASGIPPIAKTISGTIQNAGGIVRIAVKNAAGTILGERQMGVGATGGGLSPFFGIPLSAGAKLWWIGDLSYNSTIHVSGFTL